MKNPIFDIDNWREIGATLSQNKTRTFMTGFGIFWGTAILALLIGGADGLKQFMSRNFEGFATNVAIVFPGRTTKPYAGFNKGMVTELNLQDVINIRRAIPEIESSSSVNNLWAKALYGQKSSNVMLTGVESDYDKIFVPKIYEGRFINEADNTRSRKVCVVGKKAADELFAANRASARKSRSTAYIIRLSASPGRPRKSAWEPSLTSRSSSPTIRCAPTIISARRSACS